MRAALGERRGLTLVDLGPERYRLRARLKRTLGFGKRDNDLRDERVRRRFKQMIQAQLARHELEVLFAPVASIELGLIDSTLPVVYASDATFSLLNGFYDLGFEPAQTELEERFEQVALQRATRLLYPSRWAANSAIAHYGVSPKRIDIAQFGANVLHVQDSVGRPAPGTGLQLLFVGRDYVRKGGKIALETCAALRAKGLRAELTVVGCVPPQTADGVTVIPLPQQGQPLRSAGPARTLSPRSFLSPPNSCRLFADCALRGGRLRTPRRMHRPCWYSRHRGGGRAVAPTRRYGRCLCGADSHSHPGPRALSGNGPRRSSGVRRSTQLERVGSSKRNARWRQAVRDANRPHS